MKEGIIVICAAALTFVFGLFTGDSIGKTSTEKKLLESCEKHGIYIIDGAAIQCPAVIKTK